VRLPRNLLGRDVTRRFTLVMPPPGLKKIYLIDEPADVERALKKRLPPPP
jgi:hypothetical protein